MRNYRFQTRDATMASEPVELASSTTFLGGKNFLFTNSKVFAKSCTIMADVQERVNFFSYLGAAPLTTTVVKPMLRIFSAQNSSSFILAVLEGKMMARPCEPIASNCWKVSVTSILYPISPASILEIESGLPTFILYSVASVQPPIKSPISVTKPSKTAKLFISILLL